MSKVAPWQYDSEADEFRWSDEGKRRSGGSVDRDLSLRRAIEQYRPEHRSDVRRALEGSLAAGKPFECEVHLDGADDGRTIRLCGAPAYEDGDVVRIHGIAEDVSDRKQLERRVGVLRDASQELMQTETRAGSPRSWPTRPSTSSATSTRRSG